MPYKAIFFDLDDTLCDETAAWRVCTAATAASCRDVLPDINAPSLAQAYLECSDRFWHGLDPAEGMLPIQTIRIQLWEEALRSLGVSDPSLAEQMASDYGARRKARPVELFPDALPLLTALRDAGKRLVLITNGIQETHRERIAFLGLEAYFHHTLISDAVGFAKPDARVFHHALRLAGCEASEAAMVGDALKNDIAGAEAVRITAFWYNPEGNPLPPGLPPPSGGTVRCLADLTPFLMAA